MGATQVYLSEGASTHLQIYFFSPNVQCWQAPCTFAPPSRSAIKFERVLSSRFKKPAGASSLLFDQTAVDDFRSAFGVQYMRSPWFIAIGACPLYFPQVNSSLAPIPCKPQPAHSHCAAGCSLHSSTNYSRREQLERTPENMGLLQGDPVDAKLAPSTE